MCSFPRTTIIKHHRVTYQSFLTLLHWQPLCTQEMKHKHKLPGTPRGSITWLILVVYLVIVHPETLYCCRALCYPHTRLCNPIWGLCVPRLEKLGKGLQTFKQGANLLEPIEGQTIVFKITMNTLHNLFWKKKKGTNIIFKMRTSKVKINKLASISVEHGLALGKPQFEDLREEEWRQREEGSWECIAHSTPALQPGISRLLWSRTGSDSKN